MTTPMAPRLSGETKEKIKKSQVALGVAGRKVRTGAGCFQNHFWVALSMLWQTTVHQAEALSQAQSTLSSPGQAASPPEAQAGGAIPRLSGVSAPAWRRPRARAALDSGGAFGCSGGTPPRCSPPGPSHLQTGGGGARLWRASLCSRAGARTETWAGRSSSNGPIGRGKRDDGVWPRATWRGFQGKETPPRLQGYKRAPTT